MGAVEAIHIWSAGLCIASWANSLYEFSIGFIGLCCVPLDSAVDAVDAQKRLSACGWSDGIGCIECRDGASGGEGKFRGAEACWGPAWEWTPCRATCPTRLPGVTAAQFTRQLPAELPTRVELPASDFLTIKPNTPVPAPRCPPFLDTRCTDSLPIT